ncbi:type II toxin-antitoxin system RelE/ParE family toxin [Mucilaginibacter sp. UR6-11]|jgi:phage-related protein|uniref:type II toxin-antitoxin system RelE/ParE family toxin n=1 Tax=Mucilaginibacter sp. UR6-11 TaxID=1435644 RepID=UPI001E59E724|nr:type II toxin-antitoxin system RelE/ParE family toxin [Mucilaginibacter sp. UR6-11]MCC8427082.1 type II toxin-antitoxin system RelE/ParE family toxin [Mucilaginibacter sp. UR6-11]
MKKYEVEITEEAEAFLEGLQESTRKKFIKVFTKVELGFITKDDFKKLAGADDLWEFRVQDSNSWYRVFAFILKENGKEIATIFAINGFQKKGNKTPANEIERAKRLKKSITASIKS